MKGTYLKFYFHENRKHNHWLAYEWLLDQARKMGIHGGSAFRAIAGFGRDGELTEDRLSGLRGDMPVEVVFAVSDEEAERFLALLRAEKLALFYIKMPIEFGVVEGAGH